MKALTKTSGQFTFWRVPIYILEAEIVLGCFIEKG